LGFPQEIADRRKLVSLFHSMSFQSSIALEDKNNGKNRQGYLLRERRERERERERESEMTYLAVVSLRGHCKIIDEKRNEAGNLLMVLCYCV
jgi:hypothetical protein